MQEGAGLKIYIAVSKILIKKNSAVCTLFRESGWMVMFVKAEKSHVLFTKFNQDLDAVFFHQGL